MQRGCRQNGTAQAAAAGEHPSLGGSRRDARAGVLGDRLTSRVPYKPTFTDCTWVRGGGNREPGLNSKAGRGT